MATDGRALGDAIKRHLKTSVGKDAPHASDYDWRVALSLALRDRIVDPWFASTRSTYDDRRKRVYYLSMEFLIGRLIEDALTNLGVEQEARAAADALGLDFDRLVANEPDAALGNGGLGRLAACYLDSLSTLGVPAFGYGIRYEHGLFQQHFEDGRQIEMAEEWLAQRHVWEFERPEVAYDIGFGGHVETVDGRRVWRPHETIIASAYDTPVIGWQAKWANTLRLWSAKPASTFDLARFNRGEYLGAAEQEAFARTISRVLYPDDTTDQGKELRLKQEYFFTAASIRDLVRRFLSEYSDLSALPDKVAIQLNDTHPAIAGPELVRILEDEHGLNFEDAISIVEKCVAYTNHTLLPEALERWPEHLLGRVLPRHLEIIRAIDDRHARKFGEGARIVEHGSVKMGELAFIAAARVNGVSALHTDLVRKTVFADLHAKHPERIVNVTNGVTPRRWLYACNPSLAALITDAIGDGWQNDLERLSALEPFAEDAGFRARYAAAKSKNKARLADWLRARGGPIVDPAALYDIQIKRIHEYKRQHLNLIETVAYWRELKSGKHKDAPPRLKLFGGKAAPGYWTAKEIIRLINDVAKVVNADIETRGQLKIAFPENYNVSMAEILIPAADLSEQISTAGKEASGTGNMKFSLNGALTIGTLDGANVEIRERVGAENFFLFGLTADEAMQRRAIPGYARKAIEASPRLKDALAAIAGGAFSPDEPERYAGLVGNLYEHDYFLVTCDFDAYFEKQREVDAAYADRDAWTRKAILNTARMGWFSSDRAIREYAAKIWRAEALF